MHDSVMSWIARVATPERIAGKSVLEVGSLDVNGSVRPMILARGPKSYFGVDVVEGPGVDAICQIGKYLTSLSFEDQDVVISTEMLEHAEHWEQAFHHMCLIAKETLILTARGLGFPFHNPPDYWRFQREDLEQATRLCGFRVLECIEDPQVPGVFLLAQRVAWPKPARAPAPGRAF